jgi:hypothetical protein
MTSLISFRPVRPVRPIRAFVAACAAAASTLAAAQAISIQTPQLPARGDAGQSAPQAAYGQQAGPQAATHPAQGTQAGRAPSAQSAYGAQPAPAAQPSTWGQPQQQPNWGQPQQPGWGQQPSAQPGWGQGQPGGGQTAAQAPQALASPMQQQQRRPAVAHGSYASDPNASGQGQVAMVAPTPSAPGGTCRAQPSPDRQSMSLLGPDGQPRRHLPLGDFRVQLVVHSPDGMWAVAYTKLRGEPQFAAMTLDLTRCETTNTLDLPAAGEDVRFEGDSAVLQLAKGERRVRLASTRVR